jgi:hypothetical protein
MDPNKALETIRELIDSQWRFEYAEPDFDKLAEKVSELDEWLSSGGRHPSAWK